MEHVFKITIGDKYKTISITGNAVYAKAYLTGFIQALRDTEVGPLAEIEIHQMKGDITKWDKKGAVQA